MKELGFIHITKCAGTSIENMGKQDNQKWGRFDKQYGFHHRLFSKVPNSVRESKDWFAVVRNPYDRLISEYYCKYGGINKLKNPPKHNKEEFNKFIRNRINRRSKVGNHYTEQYKYFEDVPQKVQVIKMENLNSGLKKLFKKYNLNIQIPEKKSNVGKKGLFTSKDFDNETLKLINEVYGKDFKNFKYSKIKVPK